MGESLLKKKRDFNYRKAMRADLKEYRCCWHCKSFKRVDIHAIGGDVLKEDWRCGIIGLQNSRRYAIGINNLCDKFERQIGKWIA